MTTGAGGLASTWHSALPEPGPLVVVQSVDDAPRFHVDIETDDVMSVSS
ncbi:hypothetical protein ACQP2T_06880 [Nonomuraea sp. CA-143628]